MKKYGLEKSDYGHIAIAQRAWAANNPYAVYRTPLTMEEYLAAPMVADPLSRYDCVPVVAGAQAIIVAHPDRCPRGRAPRARARASRAASTTTTRRATACRPASARSPSELWQARRRAAGATSTSPRIYDDYPTMVLAQAQRSRPDPGQRSRALRAPRHRRAAVSAQHLGRHAVAPASRAVRPAASTASPRRCCSCSIAPATRQVKDARLAVDDRLRHDDVSLWRHRGGRHPGAESRHEPPGVGIWRCVKCGDAAFLSAAAAVSALSRRHASSPTRVHEAVVEEISIIRHMLGVRDRLAAAGRPACAACARDGQRITVGLRDECGPGTRRSSCSRNGPLAKPRRS